MSQDIREEIRAKYGAVAVSGLSTTDDGVRAVAEAFGYSPEELSSIPVGASTSPSDEASLHLRLLQLLNRYDINEFAASAKIDAIRPSC